MNSGYWTGVHDSDRPLQFSALFLIKWLGTKEVGHRGRLKIDHVNLKQHKPVPDFRTTDLLDLHRLCREVECKSPVLYNAYMLQKTSCHLEEFCTSSQALAMFSTSPHNPTSQLLCSSLKTPSTEEKGKAHVLIWMSLPYLFGNNDAIN